MDEKPIHLHDLGVQKILPFFLGETAAFSNDQQGANFHHRWIGDLFLNTKDLLSAGR